ncbi:putative hmg box-containing protein [Phaeoacremonium minimum UCRPA7]|uniref:Putative hmg box-containing protein n=1 Tax=Phaeoacremonium minimum (strain UCR-PA7) TaxID=1286976 RepID=R8BRI1_PHAM7|nr:putative hmg box-containing protein [Phaeoacremonium minimum UCRPA7]EOO01988.1 putative hmg box-containing protein [Phaeoacremonium minimum UCRPA7]
MTPHRPSTDTFWNQEFVDEWNDEHSPKKTLWLPEVNKSPLKKSPSKKASADRAARKVFERAKHVLAADFLQELDQIVTNGQLQKLADSTGGIKIQWTNKLNTTAGRANWKRETIKTKPSTGDEVVTKHRHHASIELAEKVIDDEHRLLNVIAHEFCHLANFMISGVTANPHGKEFKAWASKCSRSFGHRGIEVTTKHTYDIDFKYIWECADCSMEFKRHSKSINPERHRCGCCKGELKQTKPVPRATAKASEYQNFMRAQMKIVKEQNPTSPQKDILRIVADKWSRKDKLHIDNDQDAKINSVADVLDQLTLEDKH